MQLLFALLHRTKEDFFSLLFHIITLFSEALHLKLFFKIFIVLVVVCFLYRPAASILLPSQCVTASSPQSPASRSASLCSRSSLREISDSGDWRQATGDRLPRRSWLALRDLWPSWPPASPPSPPHLIFLPSFSSDASALKHYIPPLIFFPSAFVAPVLTSPLPPSLFFPSIPSAERGAERFSSRLSLSRCQFITLVSPLTCKETAIFRDWVVDLFSVVTFRWGPRI